MIKALCVGCRLLFGSRQAPHQPRTIGPDGKWDGPNGRIKIKLPGRYRARVAVMTALGVLAGLAQPFLLTFFVLVDGAMFVMIAKWLGNAWAALAIAAFGLGGLWIAFWLHAADFKRKGPMFGSRKLRNWWIAAMVTLVIAAGLLLYLGKVWFVIILGAPAAFCLLILAYMWYYDVGRDPLDLRSKKKRRKDPNGFTNWRRLVVAVTFGTEALRAKLEALADKSVKTAVRSGELAQLRRLFNLSDKHLTDLHALMRKAKCERGKHVLPKLAQRSLRPERAGDWRRVFKCV